MFEKLTKTAVCGILTGLMVTGTSLFSAASADECIFGLTINNQKTCYKIQGFSGDIGACHEDAQNFKGSKGLSTVEMFYNNYNGGIGSCGDWSASSTFIDLSPNDRGFTPYQ